MALLHGVLLSRDFCPLGLILFAAGEVLLGLISEGHLKRLCCWNEGGERSHKARNADASRGYEGQILL